LGGLSPTIKIQSMNQFVILTFAVNPLNWPSFIEIREIACSTPAWSTHGLTLKLIAFIINWLNLYIIINNAKLDISCTPQPHPSRLLSFSLNCPGFVSKDRWSAWGTIQRSPSLIICGAVLGFSRDLELLHHYWEVNHFTHDASCAVAQAVTAYISITGTPKLMVARYIKKGLMREKYSCYKIVTET